MPANLHTRPFILLGKSQSLGWRTHILFFLSAMTTAALFESSKSQGTLLDWMAIGLVGFVVTVGAIEIGSMLCSKRSWPKPRPGVATLILLAAGFLRGLAIYLIAESLGLVTQSDLAYRLMGGPLFVFSTYLISNWVVDEYLEYVKQLASLNLERENLESASAAFETQIDSLENLQRANIREMLAPAIWELQKRLEKTKSKRDLSNAIFRLRAINERIVRPMSKALSEDTTGDEITATGSGEMRRQRYRWPEQIQFPDVIGAQFFVFASLAIAFSGVMSALGPVFGFATLAIGASISFVSVAVISRFSNRNIRTSTGLILSTAIGAFIGAVVGLVGVGLNVIADPLPFLPQAIVFYASTLTLSFLLGVIRTQRNQTLAESSEMLEQRRILNSRLRQRMWLGRKALAMELHGSMQGALQSVAMRLSKLASPTAEDLKSAVDDISRAMESIERQDYLAGKQIKDLLEDLQLLWEGALVIELNLSPSALQALDDDSAASRCVLEVVREAITNSVKHGQAQRVSVNLELTGDMIRACVENDGTMPRRPKNGKGVELFETVSHSHYFEKTNNMVRLVLEIPLSPEGAAPPLVESEVGNQHVRKQLQQQRLRN